MFTGILISLAMANHDLTQLDNCTVSVVVKVPPDTPEVLSSGPGHVI